MKMRIHITYSRSKIRLNRLIEAGNPIKKVEHFENCASQEQTQVVTIRQFLTEIDAGDDNEYGRNVDETSVYTCNFRTIFK